MSEKTGDKYRTLQPSPRGFESLVLDVLRADGVSSGSQLLAGSEAGYDYSQVDGVFPSGFGELPGPTVVEVKRRASSRAIAEFVSTLEKSNVRFSSILMVVRTGGKELKRAATQLGMQSAVPTRVMGTSDIQALAEKHPAVALAYDKRFLSDAIGAFESRKTQQFMRQHLTALKSAFAEDQLVLFLGAGVSLFAGLPDWPTLLSRLTLELLREHAAVDELGEPFATLLEYFHEEAPQSPIIAARLLRDSIDKFAGRVRKALYAGYEEDSRSTLVDAIGKLCAPERARQGLVAVVNYNFDDLVEKELRRRNVRHRIVISETDSPSRDELPIYHPHGFLPSRGSLSEIHEKALVLSEDAYHSQFMDPYSWPNITQLNLLRNRVCLFVGLSMTDPNLRRLIEISQRKKPGARHYVILKDHWQPSAERTSSGTEAAASFFRGLEETSFTRLGVSVIWVEDYSLIPDLVADIRT